MLSITSLALGFSPAQKLQVQAPTCAATRASVHCGLESVAPRRAVLAAALGLGATGAAPAWAGYVTSLGIVTTSPKDAERDDELFATKQVQDGLSSLKGYQTAAKTLQASRTTPVPPPGLFSDSHESERWALFTPPTTASPHPHPHARLTTKCSLLTYPHPSLLAPHYPTPHSSPPNSSLPRPRSRRRRTWRSSRRSARSLTLLRSVTT